MMIYVPPSVERHYLPPISCSALYVYPLPAVEVFSFVTLNASLSSRVVTISPLVEAMVLEVLRRT